MTWHDTNTTQSKNMQWAVDYASRELGRGSALTTVQESIHIPRTMYVQKGRIRDRKIWLRGEREDVCAKLRNVLEKFRSLRKYPKKDAWLRRQFRVPSTYSQFDHMSDQCNILQFRFRSLYEFSRGQHVVVDALMRLAVVKLAWSREREFGSSYRALT